MGNIMKKLVLGILLIASTALAQTANEPIRMCVPGYDPQDTILVCNVRLGAIPLVPPTPGPYVKCETVTLSTTRTPVPTPGGTPACASIDDGWVEAPDNIDGFGIWRKYLAWKKTIDGLWSDASNVIQPTPHPPLAPVLR